MCGGVSGPITSYVCVSVCLRASGRMTLCVCVCVFKSEWANDIMCVCVCVCVCVLHLHLPVHKRHITFLEHFPAASDDFFLELTQRDYT